MANTYDTWDADPTTIRDRPTATRVGSRRRAAHARGSAVQRHADLRSVTWSEPPTAEVPTDQLSALLAQLADEVDTRGADFPETWDDEIPAARREGDTLELDLADLQPAWQWSR